MSIELEIRNGTKDITLNSYQLQIHEAEIQTEHTKAELSFKSSGVSYDATSQRATISFPEELPVSSKATLKIVFQGTMNNVRTLIEALGYAKRLMTRTAHGGVLSVTL